jgi:hypothetical protein
MEQHGDNFFPHHRSNALGDRCFCWQRTGKNKSCDEMQPEYYQYLHSTFTTLSRHHWKQTLQLDNVYSFHLCQDSRCLVVAADNTDTESEYQFYLAKVCSLPLLVIAKETALSVSICAGFTAELLIGCWK